MDKTIRCFFVFFGLILCMGCKNASEKKLGELPTYSSEGVLNAVIEIPAGTNQKYEYSNKKEQFLLDQINGKDRIINFIPYPGNYGFIPSTFMNPELGGDGDALDVLVLAEHVPRGTVMEVVPIALFRMEDTGELDSKVIAIPKNPKLQPFKVNDYKTFSKEFVKAKLILEYWFTSYKGGEAIGKIHWQDEKSAYREVNRWLIQQNQ